MTGGPYALSRNPMYVSELTLWLGWATFYGSVGVLIGFVILLAALVASVPYEERMLDARFGERYREYKTQFRGGLEDGVGPNPNNTLVIHKAGRAKARIRMQARPARGHNVNAKSACFNRSIAFANAQSRNQLGYAGRETARYAEVERPDGQAAAWHRDRTRVERAGRRGVDHSRRFCVSRA